MCCVQYVDVHVYLLRVHVNLINMYHHSVTHNIRNLSVTKTTYMYHTGQSLIISYTSLQYLNKICITVESH